MEATYKLSKEELIRYLDKGMSSREIEKATGHKYWNILHWIKMYGLSNQNNYNKVQYAENYFRTIDTKEKAYLLGFFIGDGCIGPDGKFTISIALADREVLDFAVTQIGGKVRVDKTTKVESKKFPFASIKIGNTKICRDLGMLFGGRTKKERRIPRIKRELEPYLVQGFFDAEGCITWGYRKDRNRIWQKVTFTSQYSMLVAIQNILDKNGITSSLRKKSGCDCYVIDICKADRVLKTLDYIYSDPEFIILRRKYNKYIALRLELGEFGESLNGQYRADPAEREGVETTGAVATQLNNRGSTQAQCARYSPTLMAT